ncbi:unnamed protein product [Leptidea sinapis]|uniref:Uncharacterized protein n=1 Tax=Leptidea sinapis TaxID=189913 RepID=A0A5E4QVB3_9NEOP|nr:unnamed protein product [Leptidea sinapis]
MQPSDANPSFYRRSPPSTHVLRDTVETHAVRMRSLRLFRCRPFSKRCLALLLLLLAFGVYCYYYSVTPASYPKPNRDKTPS